MAAKDKNLAIGVQMEGFQAKTNNVGQDSNNSFNYSEQGMSTFLPYYDQATDRAVSLYNLIIEYENGQFKKFVWDIEDDNDCLACQDGEDPPKDDPTLKCTTYTYYKPLETATTSSTSTTQKEPSKTLKTCSRICPSLSFNNCDLNINVYFRGTDINGNVLVSHNKRLYNYRRMNLQSIFEEISLVQKRVSSAKTVIKSGTMNEQAKENYENFVRGKKVTVVVQKTEEKNETDTNSKDTSTSEESSNSSTTNPSSDSNTASS